MTLQSRNLNELQTTKQIRLSTPNFLAYILKSIDYGSPVPFCLDSGL